MKNRHPAHVVETHHDVRPVDEPAREVAPLTPRPPPTPMQLREPPPPLPQRHPVGMEHAPELREHVLRRELQLQPRRHKCEWPSAMPWRLLHQVPDLRHRLRLLALRFEIVESELATPWQPYLPAARRPVLFAPPQEPKLKELSPPQPLLEPYLKPERVRRPLLDAHDSRFQVLLLTRAPS